MSDISLNGGARPRRKKSVCAEVVQFSPADASLPPLGERVAAVEASQHAFLTQYQEDNKRAEISRQEMRAEVSAGRADSAETRKLVGDLSGKFDRARGERAGILWILSGLVAVAGVALPLYFHFHP